MPFAIIGFLLLMYIVDGKKLIKDHNLKQWIVYLSLTCISVGGLILFSITFSKPNIFLYLEILLKPLSRWLAL